MIALVLLATQAANPLLQPVKGMSLSAMLPMFLVLPSIDFVFTKLDTLLWAMMVLVLEFNARRLAMFWIAHLVSVLSLSYTRLIIL